MKKTKVIVLIILILISLTSKVYAINPDEISELPYTEEYQNWLELSDEEKSKVLQPSKYDVISNQTNTQYINSITNPLKANTILKSSTHSTYNLKTLIPENLVVKNQMTTNSCWAFAALGAIETTMALSDLNNNEAMKVYDFSERHMVYSATSNFFLNNQINDYGVNRYAQTVNGKPTMLGGSALDVHRYITSDLGLVNESSLPFESNENYIDISDIQNKEITATVENTVYIYNEYDEDAQKAELKQHIVNYGGVYTGIHGATLRSDYYNEKTGAIYVSNSISGPLNHAVVIVGWDDNYSKTNFNEAAQPDNNGAWIVKNSWGTEEVVTMEEARIAIHELAVENNYGDQWPTPDDVPDSVVIDNMELNGYVHENNQFTYEIGNEGFMYVSYEDVHMKNNLSIGFKDVEAGQIYENVYQNDLSGVNSILQSSKPYSDKFYISNVFERTTAAEEKISKVTIHTYEDYNNCKVYINPNGASKNAAELELVELKEGTSVNVQAGYTTIEFANPINVTGNEFAVILEIGNTNTGTITYMIEVEETANPQITVNTGESYVGNGTDITTVGWMDSADISLDAEKRGNVTLRALTEEISILENIEIANPPKYTSYYAGQNFNIIDLKVNAIYDDGTKKEINNYDIINGENLKLGQTSVTISYTEGNITKTINQNITVTESQKLDNIEIVQEPDKTVYLAEEAFDSTGMIVEAVYENGSSSEISNYTITGGDHLHEGDTDITITYTENGITKTAIQKIVVNADPNNPNPHGINEIRITSEPNKTIYNVGDDFDPEGMIVKAIYNDGREIEITDYTIEDGIELKSDQTIVTIKYIEDGIELTTTQNITVNEDELNFVDFEDQKVNIVSLNIDDTTSEFGFIISNLNVKDENIKFYFYLSGEQGLTDIKEENWVMPSNLQITRNSDGTSNITFSITNKDMEKFDNTTVSSDKWFMYIKQEAELNNVARTQIDTLEVNYSLNLPEPDGNNNAGDNTTSDQKLPNAGRNTIIAIIIVLIIIGIVLFKKQKNILKPNKY